MADTVGNKDTQNAAVTGEVKDAPVASAPVVTATPPSKGIVFDSLDKATSWVSNLTDQMIKAGQKLDLNSDGQPDLAQLEKFAKDQGLYDTYKNAEGKIVEGGRTIMDVVSPYVEKGKGLLDTIGGFFKENPILAGAGIIGAIIGGAMDLGIIGILAIAALFAVVGGMLGDSNGLFSGMFGDKNKDGQKTPGKDGPTQARGPQLEQAFNASEVAVVKDGKVINGNAQTNQPTYGDKAAEVSLMGADGFVITGMVNKERDAFVISKVSRVDPKTMEKLSESANLDQAIHLTFGENGKIDIKSPALKIARETAEAEMVKYKSAKTLTVTKAEDNQVAVDFGTFREADKTYRMQALGKSDGNNVSLESVQMFEVGDTSGKPVRDVNGKNIIIPLTSDLDKKNFGSIEIKKIGNDDTIAIFEGRTNDLAARAGVAILGEQKRLFDIQEAADKAAAAAKEAANKKELGDITGAIGGQPNPHLAGVVLGVKLGKKIEDMGENNTAKFTAAGQAIAAKYADPAFLSNTDSKAAAQAIMDLPDVKVLGTDISKAIGADMERMHNGIAEAMKKSAAPQPGPSASVQPNISDLNLGQLTTTLPSYLLADDKGAGNKGIAG